MQPLNSDIINKILYKCPITSNIYKGIKARGDITIKTAHTSAFILNTGFKWKGIHWLLLYFNPEYTLFFDSYGFSPDIYNYPFVAERNGRPLIRNTATLQSYTSSVCGHWVIYILYHILGGQSLYSILERFIGQSTHMNDLYIFYFVKQLAWHYARVRLT